MHHIAGYDRSQTLLLPESLDEYVGPENPVRFIEAFVDGLDLTAAGGVRPRDTQGDRPPWLCAHRPPETLYLRLSESRAVKSRARTNGQFRTRSGSGPNAGAAREVPRYSRSASRIGRTPVWHDQTVDEPRRISDAWLGEGSRLI
jgi:hypothetical protein